MKGNERVLIVGGGIAGLSLATGLGQLGLSPTIVEQAPRFGAVGAGISLSVNAMAMLRRLGLANAARDAGYVLKSAEITNARGDSLSRVDFARLAADFGPTITIHRAALHEVLLSGCRDFTLHADTTVESLVDRGDAVEVEMSNGTSAEFDQVIGADGLHSRTRSQTFGETAPLYAGYTCWRFVVECPPGLDRAQEMWGRGLRLGLVPLTQDRLYCFACANQPAHTPDPEEGRVERFRTRFAGFGGFAPAALEQVIRPEQLIHNDLEEMPKHPWWKGRVLLIGDAAHATTPNMGQGAAMALEDAGVLYEMLGTGETWANLIPAFVARREPRVRFIVDQSRRIGRVGQLENILLASLRNWMTRAVPQRLAEGGVRRAAEAEV
jgi:2-polyprenyl-6-methoxyphenol hydroxylase-like FAD-dependent oxidoreductase